MSADSQSSQPRDLLKLLGHELRWKLVVTLTHSDRRVQELVSLLHEPQNLVSYHLKQLRDAKLLTERRSTADARDIYYSLDMDSLQASYCAVGRALHPALIPLDISADSPKRSQSDKSPIRILFLCTENSARSQMAEGILRHLGGDSVQVFSAGTAPSIIHPYAIETLSRIGIDISQQRAKHVDTFHDQTFDTVITVCDRARENCPVFSEDTESIHWSLPDPVTASDDSQQEAFLETAQQLTIRIRYFLATKDSTHDLFASQTRWR